METYGFPLKSDQHWYKEKKSLGKEVCLGKYRHSWPILVSIFAVSGLLMGSKCVVPEQQQQQKAQKIKASFTCAKGVGVLESNDTIS